MLEYTTALANSFRNVVEMAKPIFEGRTRGSIDLEEYLKLTMSPGRVPQAISVFYSWYRKMYNPEDRDNDLLLKRELGKQTPMYLSGVLVEFADTVEQIALVSSTLERAASLLQERGWTQGQSLSSRGEFCLVGALDCILLNNSPAPGRF